MTMVIKKPKEKRFGRKKLEGKKPGDKAEEPRHSDAALLAFSAALVIAALGLFVVLVRQPTPQNKLKTNERLTLHTPGGKAGKADTP